MNNSIYEEYMRNVLGYQPMNNYTYDYDFNYNNFDTSNFGDISTNMSVMNNIQREELENCYPDIYRMVYPMIQKICNQNTRPITKELIDSMTDEIYSAIEDKDMKENRNKDESAVKITEDRQFGRNTNLSDLIRILLLRELLGRPGFPGSRPPRPRPPRPPMRPPMGPPRPQPRPGIGGVNRIQFGQYDDLYEY